jgi:hypothetical protein
VPLSPATSLAKVDFLASGDAKADNSKTRLANRPARRTRQPRPAGLLARRGTRLASEPSHHRVDGAAMTRTKGWRNRENSKAFG